MFNGPPPIKFPDLPFGALLQICMDLGAGRHSDAARPYWSQEQLANYCQDNKIPVSKSAIGTWLSGAYLPMEVRSEFLDLFLRDEAYENEWRSCFDERFRTEYDLTQADRMALVEEAESLLGVKDLTPTERRITLRKISVENLEIREGESTALDAHGNDIANIYKQLQNTIAENEFPIISDINDVFSFPQNSIKFLHSVNRTSLEARRLIHIRKIIFEHLKRIFRLYPNISSINEMFGSLCNLYEESGKDEDLLDLLAYLLSRIAFNAGSFDDTIRIIKSCPVPDVLMNATAAANVLLNRAQTDTQKRAAIELLDRNSVKTDYTTRKLIIAKSATFENAKDRFEALYQEQNGHVEIDAYNSFLEACVEYDNAKYVFSLIIEDPSVRPDNTSYKYLIRCAPTFEEARRIIRSSSPRHGSTDRLFKLDRDTQASILAKTRTFEDAKKSFDRMRHAYANKLSVTHHNILMDMFDFFKILPNTATYNILLQRCENIRQRQNHYFQMRKNRQSRPDDKTYVILITQSANLKEARRYFRGAEKDPKINVSSFHYNALLGKTRDHKEIISILEEMEAVGIKKNIVTVNTVIKMAHDFNQAWEYMNSLLGEDIEKSDYTYSMLIKKAKDNSQIEMVMDLLTKDKNHKDSIIIRNTIISVSNSYAKAIEIYKKYIEDQGIAPKILTFATLYSKAGAETEKDETIRLAEKNGYGKHIKKVIQAGGIIRKGNRGEIRRMSKNIGDM